MTEFQKVSPSLTGGVSQQPPGSRNPANVSECINGHLSLVDGNAKRPPTTRAKDLPLVYDLPDDAEFHIVERDGKDYVVVLQSQTASDTDAECIRVFDRDDGTELTLVANENVPTFNLGYNGIAPNNYIYHWRLPGLSAGWPADGGSPIAVSISTVDGPALENHDTGTTSMKLTTSLAGTNNDNQVATDCYTRFGERVTYCSVYVQEDDSLDHFGIRLYNETQGVWHSKFFTWNTGVPELADGPDGGINADTRVNSANPGEVLIEQVGVSDWYRITYFIDVAVTTDADTNWPVAGDQITSMQILISDTDMSDGDLFYGAAVGHIDGDVPAVSPPIESGFGSFRFLTIADATFIVNTAWDTRMTRDGTDSRASYLASVPSVAESTVKITLTALQGGAYYDYSITNSAVGSPFAGQIEAGFPQQTATGAPKEPWGWSAVAQAIADAITAEDVSLTATVEGDRTIVVDSTSPVTACTVTAGRMVSSIVNEEDTLYIIAVEPPTSNDTVTWSITNDAGTHTAAPAINSADTTTQMATTIAASITAADASLMATPSGAEVVVTSTSKITEFFQYMTAEEAASNVDAYGRFSMYREQVTDVAYISVVQGVADSDYTWEIKTTAGTFTGTHTVATSGNTDTDDIANNIAQDIQAADITLEGTAAFGSVVEVRSTVPIEDFRTADTQAENLMVAFWTEVESIADLPLYFRDGYKVKISTDPTTDEEDQYVKFQTTSGLAGFGLGQWVESTDWGAEKFLDDSSMPHRLQLERDDESGTVTGTAYAKYFSYGPQDWTPRRVGSDVTNPDPSFAGGKLTDIHFANNRLGFLEDQNCVQSEVGVYFNFWRTTTAAIPDSDPIDVSSNEPEIAVLHTAHTLGEQLIVTSTAGQFVLAGDPPTPATAFLRKVTSYRFQNLEPAASGRSLFYSVPGPQDTTIVEFTRVTEGFQTDEITRAAPAYITGTAEWLVALPSANFLAVKAEAANKLYVYKYNWRSDQQKSQSAWATWEWSSNVELLHLHFLEEDGLLLYRYDGDLYLDTFQLADALRDSGLTYQVHLDHKLPKSSLTELPDTPVAGTTRVAANAFYKNGETLNLVDTDGTLVATSTTGIFDVLTVDLPADYWVGVPYTHSVTLSPPIPQTQDRLTGEHYPRSGRFSVVTLQVEVAQTGEFQADWSPECVSDTYTFAFDHVDYCDADDLLEGYYQVPVMQANADALEVVLSNDSAFPSRFLSAIWRGRIAPRGIL